jgi:hypothetical protein
MSRLAVLVLVALALVCVQVTAESVAACGDVKPPNTAYSCAQQKAWGKCSSSFMRGYCLKSCGKCSSTAHSFVEVDAPASASLNKLKIKAKGSRTAPINNYGPAYQANKAKVLKALRKTGLDEARVRMAMAIGMLETNTFNPAQRDHSKTGASTNYGLWNINKDMITRAGQSPKSLNSLSKINDGAKVVAALIKQYGVNGFLNYLRGGYSGWKDGVSYDCAGYREGIASMVRMIDADPKLLTDDRRIDMIVGAQ